MLGIQAYLTQKLLFFFFFKPKNIKKVCVQFLYKETIQMALIVLKQKLGYPSDPTTDLHYNVNITEADDHENFIV